MLLDTAGRQDHERVLLELGCDFRLGKVDEVAAGQHDFRESQMVNRESGVI